MMRRLLSLAPWMALAAAASAQVRTADVVYTYHEGIAARGLRLGDELFLPLATLGDLGWKVTPRNGEALLEAEGTRTSITTRFVAGKECVPLRRALEKLGATSIWEDRNDVLKVLTPLTKIVAKDGTIQVEAPLGFRPEVSTLISPARVVFDFKGATLDPGVGQDVDGSVKISQYRPDTVRIVVDALVLPRLGGRPDPARTFKFELPRRPRETERPVVPTQVVPENKVPAVIQSTPIEVTLDVEGPSATLLKVDLPTSLNAEPKITRTAPDVVEVFLPGVLGTLADGARPNTDAVSNVAVRNDANGTTIILYLSQPMGSEVWASGNSVSIQLLKPSIEGKLAGKVIVVDPGHGGHDNGARSGGASEKNLTLAIGKLIAAELAAQGATVIVTRKTDVFISLDERANIANRNKADLFLSVHINSTGGVSRQTGGITFFHGPDTVKKLLADCIQQEIAKVSGLPNLGTWSDKRIYQSGFSVLRNTKMPGVLLELGFINHSRDRARMLTADFQQKIARAVVKGVRVYLGDVEPN
ncbi:N-acetylmuramoyl-L-alanine amidase [bacterium]|nr:MAG: N-acetylmuramoyl-L-alanine amidase [bacterium]